MTRPVRIAASILAADFAHLGRDIAAAEQGGVDAIHVDVMDGRFVPEITIGPVIIAAVRRSTQLPVDVHLMVVEPERHVESCVRSGATSVTVHVEAATHLQRVIQRIKDLGARAAVALNPATPLVLLEPVLSEIDMALLMAVNPGYTGQRFLAMVVPKIRQLRQWVTERDLPVDLQVDGGIDARTAPQAVAAGANVLVAASAVFCGEGGIEASVKRLRAATQPARA